jgi:hypothetical protein
MNARQRRVEMRKRTREGRSRDYSVSKLRQWAETPYWWTDPPTERKVARAILIGTAIGTGLIGALVVLAIIVGHC